MSAASILGIDFGTTNTAAAYFSSDGRLKLVPVREKRFTLPSVVWFRAADKAVVGHAARMQIIDDPRHTLFEVKRFLGRRFKSEFVHRYKDRFAFGMIEGPDGGPAAEIYGRIVPLGEVVTRVIRQILDHANHAAGKPFTECVIAVPTHAGHRQREATRLAAEEAGLKVRAMINEPTAAALFYANLKAPEQNVLVFDLGGGTLDATLMSVNKRKVNVLAAGGDAFLGGADFDAAIVGKLVEQFRLVHKVDLGENKVVMQRLAFAAESAKISLSTQEQVQLRLPCVAQDAQGKFLDIDATISREAVEQLTSPLVERALGACEDVLARAKLSADQVDELVLVGGQTRMPAIRRRLGKFKKLSAERDVPPDLAVAVGAAVLGRNLARGAVGLADVVPMPISVMMPGGRTHEVIPANTPVPCAMRVGLGELPMWNAPIPVMILESVDATSIEREALGSVAIPPAWRQAQQRGNPQLELCVGQDFVLSARLVSTSGEVVPAPVTRAR